MFMLMEHISLPMYGETARFFRLGFPPVVDNSNTGVYLWKTATLSVMGNQILFAKVLMRCFVILKIGSKGGKTGNLFSRLSFLSLQNGLFSYSLP